MRLIWLFSLLLLSLKSLACWCTGPKPLTAQILKRYPYVALVRVKTLDEFTMPGVDSGHNSMAKFTVDVLENFKSELPKELVLESYGTSCDIFLRPGQTWVIFAREVGSYATVFACDYSIPYEGKRAVQDLGQLRFRSGDELLNTVRQLTGKPIQAPNNRLEKFYSNGQRALLTTYRNGGREEERVLWHANGRLWGKEFYKNGLKNGPALWWNTNGTPNTTETFANGIAIDTSRYWYNNDVDTSFILTTPSLTQPARDSILRINSLSHLRSVRIMDRQGRLLRDQEFDPNGRLINEAIGVPETGVVCRTAYDRQGQVNFLIVTRTNDRSGLDPEATLLYRIDYASDGSREIAYYDTKGRLTRWVRVKEGIETVLEEKHYPD